MTLKLEEHLLRQMWPKGDSKIPGLVAGIANSSEEVLRKRGITTPLQLAHLMAQLSHECGAGTEVVENLNYTTPAAMMEAWPKRFPNVMSTLPYLRNPRKLADFVYNGRMGNRPGTDDGYNYRGRGGSQTTGLEGYGKLGAASGHDLIGNPDLLNDPSLFFDFAVADFVMCGCLPYCAPKPSLPLGDILGVTHKLNGGTNGLAQRKQWFARWWSVLKSLEPAPASAATASLLSVPADDGVLRYGCGHEKSDFKVKALQELLSSKGYAVGKIDGEFSNGTRAAVLAAQADNGLPTTGEVDTATWSHFQNMPEKPIPEDRASATVKDLAEAGSETVKDGQRVGLIGKGIAFIGAGKAADASGALDKAKETIDHFNTFRSIADNASDLLQWAGSHWWLLALGAGAAVWILGNRVIMKRLHDHRNALNLNF